jgi:hypothetical protein
MMPAFVGPLAMISDDETERDQIRRPQYFWRAAGICRRNGLRRSAVIIAANIDALAKSLPRQTNSMTRSGLIVARRNP